MDLKVIVSIGLLAILGFLFYPRSAGQKATEVEGEWISIKSTLDNEPLHGAKIIKDNPVVKTYDLGYIYRINSAELQFKGTPKDYDILTSTVKSAPKYNRAVSAKEYDYPEITFPPTEARWVQVVINDWSRTRPKVSSAKIGARYSRHSPVTSIRTKYNKDDAFRLVDGLKDENAPKWLGGIKVEKEVEKDKKTVKEITYESPESDSVDVIFSFGVVKRVYGIAVTTGGEENNLKQYTISTSIDGRVFKQVYASGELENKTVTDSYLFQEDPPLQAKYLRLTVSPDGWYGKYPEIREVDIYTDEYRLSNYTETIEDHNAVQVYYDNCGIGGNTQSPDMTQGFPFDRGEDAGPKERYFLKPGEEVDAKNSPSERSFGYHYDKIVFSYTNLEPEAIYWVQVTYLQEKDGKRIQRLDVDGFLLHDGMKIPANEAKQFTFSIPPETYADGEVKLNLSRLAGPNAVVSEVSLLRAGRGEGVAMTIQDTGAITKAPAVATTGVSGGFPVVIDGSLNEWPSLFPLVPKKYSSDPSASPFRMYVQWDSDNLFIALKADRSKYQAGEANSRSVATFAQSPDTLHVFVDASLTRSPGMYRAGDHHFRFSPLGVPASRRKILASQIHHHLDAIPRTIEDNRAIEMAYSPVPGTSEYIMEVRIPKDKALYEFKPQSGGVIGFNFILRNPYLSTGDQLFWSVASDGASPAAWGSLELVGTVSGQPAIMDEKLANKLTSFSAGETLTLAVRDPDRNTDRNSPQSIKVLISGDLTKDSKEIVLQETTPSADAGQTANNSDLFAAKIKTEFGTTPSEDPFILTIQGKESVTLYYLDPYYGPDENDVEVTASAIAAVGITGAISIQSESGEEIKDFNAGDKLFFRVEDADLIPEKAGGEEEGEENKKPSQISVIVASSDDSEEAVLIDEQNTGVFVGSIETIYNMEGAGDGVLQVVGYEAIKATYNDRIQATGNTNVPVIAEAIVNIGNTGRVTIGRSETGSISDLVELDNFNAGDDIFIRLLDGDLNMDREAVESVSVKIEGSDVQDNVILTLTETQPSSVAFAGVLRTAYGLTADTSNDTLEIKGNEVVTISYDDALQATGATHVIVSATASANVGNDGTISLLRSNYFWDLEDFNAGDRLYFKVEDADLNLDSGVRDRMEISVVSEETHDGEMVTLEERNPDAGVFFGSLETKYAKETQAKPSTPSVSPDGILQVQGKEKITAIYLDTLRVTGETNVPVTDSCTVNVGSTGKITVYNKVNPYTPIAGFPDEGWKSKFNAGETLVIRLEDMDLNVSSAAAEIFQVNTTENVIQDSVPVMLTEVSGSAGIFTGEVKTEYGVEAVPGDGILQVQGEGKVSIFYRDEITDTGQTQVYIPVTLTVQTGHIGAIQALGAERGIPISSFSAGDSFIVRVRDGDLNLDPRAIDRASVMVSGNLLEDQLQALMQETELNSGIFDGRVQSVYANSADLNDILLQVKEKEVIILTYIDQVGVTGETGVPISVELIVRSGSAGSLLIVDENYRELPGFSTGQKIYFRLDDFVLSNTSPNTPARIIVRGEGTKDEEEVLLEESPGEKGIYIGSIATSYGTRSVKDGVLQVRGGEEVAAIYRPQTPGAPSSPITDTTYTSKGSTGKITITGANGLKLSHFNAGDTLYLKLEDMDLNLDLFVIDTVDIWIAGDAIASGKTVTLTETREDSGVFTGSIDTRYGRGVFGSAVILEVVGGEQVTAVYYDALTASGETDVKVTDSCRASMLGTATYAPEGVVIDGSMARWPLENSLRAGDEGSNIYVQWDKDNLYILAYIMDSDVIVPDATEFWDGADALEIHIDTDPTSETSAYLDGLKKPSYYFFWFCPKGAGPDGSEPYVGQNKPETVYNYSVVETAVRIFPGSRYVMEIRIPLDPVLAGFDPYKTSKDDRIGFNYIIRRSNAPQLRWALGEEGEPNLPPSYFGTLILKRP